MFKYINTHMLNNNNQNNTGFIYIYKYILGFACQMHMYTYTLQLHLPQVPSAASTPTAEPKKAHSDRVVWEGFRSRYYEKIGQFKSQVNSDWTPKCANGSFKQAC